MNLKNLNPFSSNPKSDKANELASIKAELTKSQDIFEESGLDFELNTLEVKGFADPGSPSGSGLFSLTEEILDISTLQKWYCTEGWFFVVVHAIAKSISSLRLKVQKEETIKQTITQADGSETTVCRTVWRDATGEIEQSVFDIPNDIQVPMEFWMLIIIDWLATGNSYLVIHEDDEFDNSSENLLRNRIDGRGNGKKKQLFRLNPSIVQPISSEDGKFIDGYNAQTNFGFFTFDKSEIIHLKMPNPCDPFLGHAPILVLLH